VPEIHFMSNFSQNRFPVAGILGGGQLAQMLSQAAQPIGITTNVLVRNMLDVLPSLSGQAIQGDWNNPETASMFAQSVDIVLLENEFINPDSLAAIEKAGIPLIPNSASIRLIQDKWMQKTSLIRANIPVVSSTQVQTVDDIISFAHQYGWPVVLKRRHESYDGKGNVTVRHQDDVSGAYNQLNTNDQGLFVEQFCPFEREIAVMVTRSVNGETCVYPVVDTFQKDHICHVVKAPSSLPAVLAVAAQELALSAIEAINGFGTMGVEMFLTADQRLLVNELAPRVHNSGHYTIEGCVCSQFENHIRASLGWPLGSTAMTKPVAVMVNLIGEGVGPAKPSGLSDALALNGAHIHIYGKTKSARGRKMGHITALGDSMPEVELLAKKAASMIKFGC
jgi:5-(carboxyamino)imidazole ribonucleotide synthase